MSLEQIYEIWSESAYKRVITTTKLYYCLAWERLKPLWKIPIEQIRGFHFQSIFDGLQSYSKSFLDKLKQLCVHLMNTAILHELIHINYAGYIKIHSKAMPRERDIFTDEEIYNIYRCAVVRDGPHWQTAQITIVLIFTGLRPTELFTLKRENVYPKQGYIIGGSKTAAGRNRLVPIMSIIRQFVLEWYIAQPPSEEELPSYIVRSSRGNPINLSDWRRRKFYPMLEEMGIDNQFPEPRLTPYSARHTFASLCSRAAMKDAVLAKIMGHTSSDFTYRHYVHSQLPEYVSEIEKVSTLFAL